ncbi:hypothetical protein [Micromonospora sp. MA102]|uniref:hypothetical protein n=1 Tax=Micromonospora sp. MA102 TaxID=2952755 RepID=UPI0021C82122|nr:hypothetical protein [Micromonospora sp. MA102]
MTGVPRVFASGQQIAALRDTNVYLLTVELWSGNQVTARLVGQLNERMQSAIDSYYVALQGWTPGQSRDAVPSSPGEEMFRALRVGLSDEAGTAFTLESGSSGGTRHELLYEWHFRASHELHGSHLTLTVMNSEGAGGSKEIDFPQ